jgi:lysophospholipase L1-like esterase
MIDRLVNAGIQVVLLGLPYNPVLMERLAPGQWEYYNSSVTNYSQIEGVTVLNMMWDSGWAEEDFSDRTHMSRQGERKLAELLVQPLDQILGY